MKLLSGRPAQSRWNPALFLTLLRALLIPLFVWFLLQRVSAGQSTPLLLLLFGIIVLSDMLDGPLARHYHQVSAFGSVADVLADMTFILSSLWTAVYAGLLPWWVPAAIVVQIIQFVGDSLFFFSKTSQQPFRKNTLGKLAGILYYIVVGILCLHLTFPFFFPSQALPLLSVIVVSYTLVCILGRVRLYWKTE